MRGVHINTERLTIRYIEENDWKSIQAIWLDFKKSEYVIYDNYKETDSESVKQRIAKWAHYTTSTDQIGLSALFSPYTQFL